MADKDITTLPTYCPTCAKLTKWMPSVGQQVESYACPNCGVKRPDKIVYAELQDVEYVELQDEVKSE